MVSGEKVRFSIFSGSGFGDTRDRTIMSITQKMNRPIEKLRKAQLVITLKELKSIELVFDMMSIMKRAAPKIAPTIRVVIAALPVALFQRMPVRNTAVMGAPIYAWTLWRYW